MYELCNKCAKVVFKLHTLEIVHMSDIIDESIFYDMGTKNTYCFHEYLIIPYFLKRHWVGRKFDRPTYLFI